MIVGAGRFSDEGTSAALAPNNKLLIAGNASSGSNTDFATARIELNLNPLDLTLSPTSIAENQPVGTTVGTFSTIDPDAGDTFTYSLVSGTGSTDNASFQIVGSQLRTSATFNYTNNPALTIRVRSTDNGGALFEKVFRVTVTPIFGPASYLQTIVPTSITGGGPVSAFGSSVAIANDQFAIGAPGSRVGGFVLAGAGFTFAASNTTSSSFYLNPAPAVSDGMGVATAIGDGVVVFGASLDQIAGGTTAGRAMIFNASTGALITTISSPVSGNNVKFGEKIAASGNRIAIAARGVPAANSSTGVVYIYDLAGNLLRTLVDPSPHIGERFAIDLSMDGTKLAVGSSGNILVFDVNTGAVIASVAPAVSSDPKVAISGNLLAIGFSGATTSQGFTAGRVYVYNHTTGQLLRTFEQPSQANGDLFGDAVAMDGDYLVVGAKFVEAPGNPTNSGAAYVYNTATGSFVGGLSTPTPINNGQFGSSVAIRGARILVGSLVENRVHVFSLSGSPFSVQLSNTAIAENSAIGSTLGTLSASSTAIGTTTFALVAGTGSNDNGSFQIVGNQLRTNSPLDFETKSSYSILVEGTDSSGKKSQQIFVITVSNVNESPTALLISNNRVSEDQPIGTLVATLSTLDPDASETFTYSLPVGQADNDQFTIVGNQLKTNNRFDYETKDNYTVSIRSQDSSGLSITWAYLITIDDLNPPASPANPRYDLRNVVDLNNTIQSSTPSSPVELAGATYFAGTSPTFGRELHRSDRTLAGTSVIKDLVLGGDANPESLTVFNGNVYFLTSYTQIDGLGNPGSTGFGLWRTDGTALGTTLVKDLTTLGYTGGMNFKPMQVVNGRLVFTLAFGFNEDLWSTDGTAAGTVLLANFVAPSGASPFSTLLNTGSQLFVNLYVDQTTGSHTLWRTDGTVAGTRQLRSIQQVASGSEAFDGTLVALAGIVYFSSTDGNGTELWRTDGSVAGTSMVKDINLGGAPPPSSNSGNPAGLAVVNGLLMFSADDGVNGRELWKSDGTAAGTVMVKDIRPSSTFGNGSMSSSNASQRTAVWNGKYYFAANDGVNGLELWSSDGTGVGTTMLSNVGSIAFEGTNPSKLVALTSRLLFTTDANSFVGSQLWSTDGTVTGTVFIADPDGNSPVNNFAGSAFAVGNQLFFNANNTTLGNELWVSDGTTVGTSALRDIATGTASGLTNILAAGASGVYFQGNDGVIGTELGYSNGTVTGTYLLDVARGTPPSDVREVVSNGSILYVATGQGLYKVDDTNHTSVLLTNRVATQLTVVGTSVFFVADSASQLNVLWRSTGTASGTAPVTTFTGGSILAPQMLTNVNGALYYTSTTAANGRELWSGNSQQFEFAAGATSGNVQRIMPVGSKLYVVANGKLYVKDNATYTYLVDADASTLMPWESVLYFGGFSAANGYELWRSEGTLASTYLVADIVPGPDSSYPGGGVIAGNSSVIAAGEAIEAKLVFRALDTTGASQLFATNGTTAGTIALTNEPLVTLAGGITASLAPVNLRSVDGRVYFEGYRQDVGRELWISNGTPAGTKLVKDLRPGTTPAVVGDPLFISAYFNLQEMTAYRGRLFFSTKNSDNGTELWTSDGTIAGSGIAVDALPGTSSGNAKNLVVLNDRLYLAANTFDYGIGTQDFAAGELFRLNEAPYAIPASQVTALNAPASIKLRGIDRDNDTLSYEIVTGPQHGTVAINGRTATFTPATGYTGLDGFTYRVFDGSLYSDAATVSIGVQAATTRQLSFATSSQTMAEQDTVTLATINLTQAFTEFTAVPYSIGYGGLQSNTASEVVFSPGQTQAQIPIQLSDNTIDQSTSQQIEVTLLANPFVTLGSIPELLITLTDNDPAPQVFFVDYQRTFSENAGTVSFEVGLSRPSDRTVTTEISIGSTNSTLGVDFSASPITLVEFAPGQTRRRVTVKLLDDNTPEARETLLAGIGTTTSATVTSDPNRFRSLLWIDDDDVSVISVSPAVTFGVEGDSVVLQATRSGGNLTVPLTVPITLSGDATSNSDFTLSSTFFQFAANATTATITANLVADGQAETFEALTVELPISASFNRGTTYQSYIGIYDQDRATISLEFGATNSSGVTAPVSVSERLPGGAGNWRIDVIAKLSAPSSQTISVPVVLNSEALSGYAQPGIDFLFSTADFVFAPGQTQVTRVLEILNDSLVEPDERLQISLAPTATQFDLRKNGIKNDEGLSKQLVIRNDDNSYSITSPERVSESVGTFQFSINWDVPLPFANSVFINFSGSLSTSEFSVAGMNNRLANEVFFGSGEQSKTFTVSIVNDTIFETLEQLTISAVSTVGDAAPRSVTISDDDSPPTASFTTSKYAMVTGQINQYSIPIQIDRVSAEDLEVTVSFTGPATKGIDYKLTGFGDKGIVKIPAGRNVGSLEFVVLDPVANGVFAKTGVLEFDVTITGGQNVSVGNPKPKARVKIIDEHRQYLACVNALVSELSAAQTKELIGNSGTLAIFVGPTPGQILNRCGVAPSSSSSSSSSNVNTTINTSGNQTADTTIAGQVMIGNAANGILESSQVYFDANFNSVADYLDRNQNGRQDADEPNEPTATTDLGGTFAINIPAAFDRNSDGVISADEGRYVIQGGIDRSTDLPWTIQMSAPVGIYGITPVTTLIETLMRRKSMPYSDAASRAVSALDLGTYDLRAGQSIYSVLARDPSASLAYARQQMLNGVAITAASLIRGSSGLSLQMHFDEAFDFLADTIARAGVKLDLTNTGVVTQLLTSMNNRLSTPLGSSSISGAAQLIALGMSRIQLLRINDFAEPQDYLRAITRIKKLLYTSVADDLQAVGAGTRTIATVLATYTGPTAPNFDSLSAAQVIGIVIPPVIGVTSAAKVEGASGTQLMEFSVQLVGEHNNVVSVNYQTFDATASSAAGDYASRAGTLTWPAGDNAPRIVQVPITGDSDFETDEYFNLLLTDATNAVARNPQGFGFIVNDDAFVSPTITSSNNYVVYHGTELTEISQNNATLTSGRFVNGLNATLNGSASNPNAFQFDFSSNTYNADRYQAVGGSAGDALTLTAGRFQRIIHRVKDGSTGTVTLDAASNSQVKIDWSGIENVLADISSVDQLVVHLPAEVTAAVIDDPDPATPGQMRVRSLNNQFTPIVFTVPNSKISIVRVNRTATIQTLSVDPSFNGNIEVLAGGFDLSNATIAENQPVGSSVGTFTTQDPLLGTIYSVSLVAGIGSTGNGSFALVDKSLQTATAFNFETQNSYTIRARAANGPDVFLEQTFTIAVTNVNEAPNDILLSNNTINENSLTNTVIGLLSGSDPDNADALSFSLPAGQGDNAAFNISGSSLRANTALNFEAKSSYAITVRVTDAGGLFIDRPFTISVINLAELQQPVQIGDGSAQRSSVTGLTIDFDSDMIVDADAFLVQQRTIVNGSPVFTNVTTQFGLTTLPSGATRATLTFSGAFTRGGGALVDGYYQLTILGAKVRIRSSGLAFDGDGNGVAGGDYVLGAQEADKFFALYGDTNGDGLVGVAEFGQFRTTFGKNSSAVGYNQLFDYDGDNIVGVSDFGQFRSRFGKPKLQF